MNTLASSDPEPDFSSLAPWAICIAQTTRFRAHEAARRRWQPTDSIDANLTYYFQDMEVRGRQQNHVVAFGTEKPSRPSLSRANERQSARGARITTVRFRAAHLGIRLFDVFGSGSAINGSFDHAQYTPDCSDVLGIPRDGEDDRTMRQELRLVSNSAGGHVDRGLFWYNQVQIGPRRSSHHYDEYLGGNLRQQPVRSTATTGPKAIFGEIGFDVTDKLRLPSRPILRIRLVDRAVRLFR